MVSYLVALDSTFSSPLLFERFVNCLLRDHVRVHTQNDEKNSRSFQGVFKEFFQKFKESFQS